MHLQAHRAPFGRSDCAASGRRGTAAGFAAAASTGTLPATARARRYRRDRGRSGTGASADAAASATTGGGVTAPMRRMIICWRRRSRGDRMAGIEQARIDDRRGEQRRFRRRQSAADLRKYVRARGFRAVDAVAPLDHVQIQLEDPLLGQLRFETARDQQLAHLADRILRRRQIQVLGELLRDRARRRARTPSARSSLPSIP